MNGNAIRWIGAAAVGLLIIAGCGGGASSPAATISASTAPSSAATPTTPPTPTPAAVPSPTPIDTTGWVPYSSDRFGYDMAIPPTWTAEPATRDWSLEIDNEVTTGADHFIDKAPGVYQVGVQAFSTPVPSGMSKAEWVAQFDVPFEGCTPLPPAQWESITVDGQPAMFNPSACAASQAYVFIGDRVYRFSVWREDQQALLKAFLSTVRLHP